MMTGEELIAEHAAAGAAAREHKRQANRHRQLARAARARQAEIEARCRRLGIEIRGGIEGEGANHGRQQPAP